MGQNQSSQAENYNPVQGYRSMGKISMRTLSAQVALYQRGEEVLAHSAYPLEAKSLELLQENNRYYNDRASLYHSHLLALHGSDLADENGASIREAMRMGKLTSLNTQAKKANVNTMCSLNLFQQNCKRSLIGNSQPLSIKLQLYHEFETHTLEMEVEMRKKREDMFREKELWMLMSHCVSAGRALQNAGMKEPLLSPNSIKIDCKGNYKVGEWEFTHFYEEPEEEQQEDTYFYEEGETFLKPASSRIKCENSKLHRKRAYNVLTSYYWAPQGTSGMQSIITIGRKQQYQSKQIGNNQIFSLGMTILHLLLMRPIYQSETFSEKRISSFIKEAMSLRASQGLEISSFLLKALERMLAWDAEDRIGYEELQHEINSQRSTHTAMSVLTTEHDDPSSGTFREKIGSSKSLICGQGKGSGSVSQGEGDMDHPLEQSRKVNLPNTIRSPNLNYEKIDVTIKRERREWQKFENRIQESSYKVKQIQPPCRQLFPPVSMFTFPAEVLLDDEEDVPNSESLCGYNPNLIVEKEKIDFEFSQEVGLSSIQNSIKILDISNIKAQDDTKEVSKQKTSFIKFDVPDEEESFSNLFNENKKKSQAVREDSLLLKSSVKPLPAYMTQSEKQENLFTPPELLALIRSSAFSAQSRISHKSARHSNSEFFEQPMVVSKEVEAELCNSVFVKESFAKGYYQGGKVDGQRSGYGTFYYNEGGKYCGDWENNQMHGKGTLYYADGRIAYQGDWSHDSLCGKGILYNQNPTKLTKSYDYTCFDQSQECWVYYQGSFHNDDKWGKGVLLLSNGEKYQGNFRNDLIDGKGIFYTLGGQRIIGEWQANQLIKVIKEEAAKDSLSQ